MNPKPSSHFCRPGLLLLVALACATGAPAATLYWDGNGTGASGNPPTTGVGGAGTWDTNTTANWWSGTGYQVWNAAGGEDLADFRVIGGAVTIPSGQAPRANKLNIAVNSVTFSGGTVAFTGAPGIIDVNNTSSCTFSSGATGSLKVIGTGQTANLATATPLIILGSTTLTNFELALNQDQNHIILGNAAALGSATGTVKLTKGIINLGNTDGSSTFSYLAWPTELAGGTIRARFNTGTWNGATTLSANSQLMTRNAAGVALIFSTTATINLNTNTLNLMPSTNSAGITLNGVISGAGNLATVNNTLGGTDTGTGVVTLGAANTFSGTATTTVNLGTFALNHVNALQNATLDTAASGSQAVTFIVAGNNTYNLGALTGADALAIGGNTISVGSKAVDTTFTGAISGVGGALTKVGGNTLALGGLNTYSGATTIAGGKLVGVVGGSCASSVVTVNSGSGNTLGVLISNSSKGWTNAGVVFAAGTTALQFDFGNTVAPGTNVAPLVVNGNVDFTSTPAVSIKGGNLPAGDYPLITWTGVSGVPPVTATLPARVGGGSLTVVGNTLYVNITGSTQPIAWTGGNGTWDLNNAGNNIWKDSAGAGSPTYYQETASPGDSVVFDDTYGTGGIVTLNSSVGPANVTVSNAVADYTITGSGAIAGTTTLVKKGAARLTVGTTNTFAGGILHSAGTLQPGNSGAFNGTGVLTLSGTATLDLAGYDAAFTNIAASVAGNTITNSGVGSGTDTLTISAFVNTIAAKVTDNGTRKLAVTLAGSNNADPLSNTANDFSGGLNLGNSIRLTAADNSAITGGKFGKGPITIGTAAQIYFSGANRTIGNDIIVNDAAGNGSRNGSFRLDTAGNVLSGTITANMAPASFQCGGGTGGISLTGKVTGTNGLTVGNPNGTSMNLTLNTTPNLNDYEGATTIANTTATMTLGAADQIPNGTGKGNVAVTLGTLNLAGFSETINGLSGAGNVDGASGTPVLTLGDGNATSTFSGVILNTAGTLSLTKIGAGTQILSGTNTYTGVTLISAGTLQLGNGSTNGVLSPSSAITANGTLVFNHTDAIAQGTHFAGGITGTGNLTQAGSGTTILNTANSYAGLTTVSGGAFTVQNAGALGTTAGGTVVTNAARLELDGGLTWTGEAITISGNGGNFFGALQSKTGVNTWAGSVTIAAINTRIGAQSGASLIVDGVIGSGGNNYGITFRPADTTASVVVSAANTYVGDTTIVGGPLRLANGDHRLPIGTRLIFGVANVSGSLDLNGRSQQVAGLSVASGTANYVTNSSATPATLTVNTPTASPSTNAAVIAGNLSLLKTGPDTLTLTAANAYSGNTTVAGGTLALAQATLATNATITVSNGAVLQLDFATTNRVGALVLNGVSQASGYYSGANAAPYLSGAGTLQVVNLNPVLPTTPTNLTFTVSSGNVTLGWPAAYTGWILQTQTNSLNVGLTSNNWYYVPGSELTNLVSIPISQFNPTVFFRMARTNQP